MKLAPRLCFIVILALGVFGFTGSTRAIVLGQLDDFEDGTLQGWRNGAQTVSLDSGGPAGANDDFMEVIALGGGGPGSHLTVINQDQWLGNYLAANVTAIEMDLKNLGDVDLTIRLGFKQESGPSSPGYLSAPFSLPVGSGWQHAIFLVDPASMIAVNTVTNLNTFFANGFSETRIINAVGTDNLTGEPIAGQLGIDNIHAIPEPGAALLTSVGLLLVIAAGCRKD